MRYKVFFISNLNVSQKIIVNNSRGVTMRVIFSNPAEQKIIDS